LLVDKAKFPRDKICGDGLSGWTVNILNRISPELINELTQAPASLPSWGARFIAPNQQILDVPFKDKYHPSARPPGYVAPRLWFDNYLLEECRKQPLVTVLEESAVSYNQLEENGRRLTTQTGDTIQAEIVVAANGAHSREAQALAGHKLDKRHHVAGVRAYYEGIKDLHPDGHIELHFLKDFLPGYFWIFPLPDGRANVGAGMRSDVIAKKRVNLKKALVECINTTPALRERFAQANRLDEIKGFGLPLGSKQKKLSTDRLLLVGDAASLIDPFTGEGIGNALASGETASQWILKALETNTYEAKFLKGYDKAIYQRLGKELKLSKTMQDLLNYPWLFSMVVNKATTNKTLRETISCMLTDLDVREQLKKPSFYFKVLFG
jgi:geranylgeranyl reductase family protein